MIATRHRKRGEAGTEYIIIAGVVMVCAIVGLFSVWAEIGRMAEKAQLCVNCDESANSRELLADFDSVDANGDGRITRSELGPEDVALMSHDTNGDGVLTRNELGAPAQIPTFDSLDVNGDGQVDETELAGAPELMDRDTNGDGVLSRDELGAVGPRDMDDNDDNDANVVNLPSSDGDPDGNDPGPSSTPPSSWSFASLFTGAPAVYDMFYGLYYNLFGYGDYETAPA